MIKVSVIMAVYNTNREIIELAIDSILNQSIKELELIICDDGSSDGIYESLEEISNKDDRIVLLRNPRNMGASAARNRCIAKAKAEFIAIMDADDYSDEKRLEKQIEFLENNSEFTFVGVSGQYFSDLKGINEEKYYFCEYPQKEDFLFTLPFVHASLLFRKKALMDVKCYKEESIVTRSEDYDLMMRLYAKGYYGANLKEVLYFIRLDKSSYKRRKYRYRLLESVVKYKGFRSLGLMPRGIIYALKPLIVGLIPIRVLNMLRRKYYDSKRQGEI
ncbi:Glycosyltransferases, probably involved in cell wall biogenesis [Desulfitobacterium sp. LBE]|uniref:glycosyltransferase family 2 protein n=1 Tax=Desulfitobacterium sp. LBE TaxID=884086 RepID=UPI00119B08A4|nr:glycosyltransferase family 2 protein [Desulfitobacterium sp. LBE]TWH59719.1 Glycosyltransferases, probably involved in cell wall biogenesis [Desulfitobacterium sp. LBE]